MMKKKRSTDDNEHGEDDGLCLTRITKGMI